jgi:hypothetical protein
MGVLRLLLNPTLSRVWVVLSARRTATAVPCEGRLESLSAWCGPRAQLLRSGRGIRWLLEGWWRGGGGSSRRRRRRGPGWNTGLGHDYGPIWGHVDLAIGERGGNKVELFADEGDIANIRRLWSIKSYDYIQQKRIRQVQKTHFRKLIGAAFSILDIVGDATTHREPI